MGKAPSYRDVCEAQGSVAPHVAQFCCIQRCICMPHLSFRYMFATLVSHALQRFPAFVDLYLLRVTLVNAYTSQPMCSLTP